MKQVMIVAAEASSALFAQRLLEFWQARGDHVQAFGVGTESMEALGFERLGKSEEMAVVGAAEIIEHFGHLKSVFNRLVSTAAERRPQVAIVMDYPEFNLMLAKKLHKLGIPVVYYVSPQVWAWRQGRVETIKKYCRKVLLLFPMEVPFYEAKQVPFVFVGHPILDELSEKYFTDSYRKEHRERYGIESDEIVLGLMPGSRRGEIRQHLSLQLQVAKNLCRQFDKVRVMVMVAPTLTKEFVQDNLHVAAKGASAAKDVDFPVTLIKDEPFEMIHLADFVLAASGTATLMVALLEKPMVIMYKMKFLTGIIAKVVVRGVRFFGLVNLILGREAVPERWQHGANPEELTRLMKKYIEDKTYSEQVRNDLKTVRQKLGERGATERVASALQEFF